MRRWVLLLLLTACEPPSRNAAQADRIIGLYKSKDYQNCCDQAREYLKKYPKDADVWTTLGQAADEVGQLEEALAASVKAAELNPRMPQPHVTMGVVYRKKKDYAKATECYAKAIHVDPTHAHAYTSMAVIELKRMNDRRALELAKKAYDLNKTEPVIASNLSVVYHYNGMIKERDEMFEVAKRLGYSNPQALKDIFSGKLTVRDE